MSDGIFSVVRGACGFELTLSKDEKSERYYTSNTCQNPEVKVGSSTQTVRMFCAKCPHAQGPVSVHGALGQPASLTAQADPTPAALPAAAPTAAAPTAEPPTPSAPQPSTPADPASAAAEPSSAPPALPTDIPPPGAAPAPAPELVSTPAAPEPAASPAPPAAAGAVQLQATFEPTPGITMDCPKHGPSQLVYSQSPGEYMCYACLREQFVTGPFSMAASAAASAPEPTPQMPDALTPLAAAGAAVAVPQAEPIPPGTYAFQALDLHTAAAAAAMQPHDHLVGETPRAAAAVAAQQFVQNATHVAQAYAQAYGAEVSLPPWLSPPAQASLPAQLDVTAPTASAVSTLPQDVPASLPTQQLQPPQPPQPAAIPQAVPTQPTQQLQQINGIVAQAAPAPAPAQTQTFIPGMNLAGLSDQSVVDIERELQKIPELVGGPSVGGLSWSTGIKAFKACHRQAYFAIVRGLQKKERAEHFDLGTLVHACFEMHYRTGGQKTFLPCDVVQAAGAVDMANDARRYVYAACTKWGPEEQLTWDVRGIEAQGTWFAGPFKLRVKGRTKTVYIPITCRHDLVLARHDPGAACHPPGPVPSGVFITDHKTAKSLSYDLTKGYGMDGQFKLNALIFRRAEQHIFGPLNGVVVSIIAKHQRMTPDSLFRVYTTVDEASVEEFWHNELIYDVTNLYEMLANPEIRDDPKCWKKNHAACSTRYGLCPFFNICDTPPGGEEAIISAFYREDPAWQKHVENFVEPPAEYKRVAGKSDEQVEAEKAKRDARSTKRGDVKGLICQAFINAIAQYPTFSPGNFLRQGVDKKTVKEELGRELSAAWEIGTSFSLLLSGAADDKAAAHVTAKGISWSARDIRGSLSWKTLAGEVVKDWWNLTKNAPQSAEDDDDAAPPAAGVQPAPAPPQA